MYMTRKPKGRAAPKPLYGPHFLRQWREEAGRRRGREYTLEEVGEAVGISHAQLGRIERRLQKYNQELLEDLAELYKTTPASLIMRDPTDETAIWSLWDQAQEAERQDTTKYLEFRVKTRTGT